MAEINLPALSLHEWQTTRDTIHKYSLVIGEIRAALTPRSKHWWHINLRPGVTGLTTPPVPVAKEDVSASFKMLMDFTSHELQIIASSGERRQVAFAGQPLAIFRDEVLAELKTLGIEPGIDGSQFAATETLHYDRAAAARFWQALNQITGVFFEFKSGLRQETSPLGLWPHHFDMAFVWFSGRLVPGQDANDEDHADEQMSFGFSTGDEAIAEPYFYLSAYPMPDKLKDAVLPEGVSWYSDSWQGALLKYDTLVQSERPRQLLLNYLRTVQSAGSALMLGK